jgi:hypothetical protein
MLVLGPLPVELLFAVFSYLNADDLRRCATVKRSWTYPAQSRLFSGRNLVIGSEHEWSELVALFAHNAAIRDHTHALHICDIGIPIEAALGLFPHVERLSLSVASHVPARLFESFPTLSTLLIDGVRHTLNACNEFIAFPDDLKLREVHFDYFTASHGTALDALMKTASARTLRYAQFYQAWKDPMPAIERFLAACPNIDRLTLDLAAAGTRRSRDDAIVTDSLLVGTGDLNFTAPTRVKSLRVQVAAHDMAPRTLASFLRCSSFPLLYELDVDVRPSVMMDPHDGVYWWVPFESDDDDNGLGPETRVDERLTRQLKRLTIRLLRNEGGQVELVQTAAFLALFAIAGTCETKLEPEDCFTDDY